MPRERSGHLLLTTRITAVLL